MKYEFRETASSGHLCWFLLPLCLASLSLKHDESGIHLLLLSLCLHMFFIAHPRKYYKGKMAICSEVLICVLLSIPGSFFCWYFLSYGIIPFCLLCSTSIFCYDYIVHTILISCPKSFSFGEVHVVAQAILLFLIICLVSLFEKCHILKGFSTFHSTSESIKCLQILILGTLLIIYQLYVNPVLRQGIQLWSFCLCIALMMMIAWNVLLKKNIFSWLLSYCLHDNKRVYLIVFWLLCSVASIGIVIAVNCISGFKASTITRKYFHFIISLVCVSGILYDLDLIRFASGIALMIFMILEVFRIIKVPFVGPLIHDSFKVFLDEKDSGLLILTHIYLLIGSCCPVWLSGYGNNQGYHISLLSGVISVGFGDTAAAIGGTLFGKHRWKESKKTYEGSLCAFVAQLLISSLFLYLAHDCSMKNVLLITVAVLLTTILEAITTQVDNLVLPLFMFSILIWVD